MYDPLRFLATTSGKQSLVLFVLALVGACASDGCAQSASTGTVTDPQGAVVPNATITLRNQRTGQTITTGSDAEGLYRFIVLPPGQYELTVVAAGFALLVLREMMIQITEVKRIPIQLAITNLREEDLVKPPLLQTENAAITRMIDRGTVVALPQVNRNYTQILGLRGGTNTDVVDVTQLVAGSQEFRANGARSGDNNFMLNGVDANSYGANYTFSKVLDIADDSLGPAELEF